MKELKIINQNGQLLVDSREVAEMVGKEHSNLMRDIRGYEKTISENSNLNSKNFFIKSNYKVPGNNKTYDCYLLTRKGCDMVANKMTGEKGIQYKNNGTWLLKADYSELGYTSTKQLVLDNGHITYDRKWTGTGRDFILDLLKGGNDDDK